jgi:hypothetical protein
MDTRTFCRSTKKIGTKHSLNFTLLGAPQQPRPQRRHLPGNVRPGRHYPVQPQLGLLERRKTKRLRQPQPPAFRHSRYDWKPGEGTSVQIAAYGQAGENGSTRLDWFNGYSPEPDYNRRLPSALPDPAMADAWAQELRDNESLRQINWAGLWEANTINTETIHNANGVAGNSVTGKRSQYVIADFRSDSKEGGFNALLRQSLSNRFALTGGANYQHYLGRNFKTRRRYSGRRFYRRLGPLRPARPACQPNRARQRPANAQSHCTGRRNVRLRL